MIIQYPKSIKHMHQSRINQSGQGRKSMQIIDREHKRCAKNGGKRKTVNTSDIWMDGRDEKSDHQHHPWSETEDAVKGRAILGYTMNDRTRKGQNRMETKQWSEDKWSLDGWMRRTIREHTQQSHNTLDINRMPWHSDIALLVEILWWRESEKEWNQKEKHKNLYKIEQMLRKLNSKRLELMVKCGFSSSIAFSTSLRPCLPPKVHSGSAPRGLPAFPFGLVVSPPPSLPGIDRPCHHQLLPVKR